MFARASFSQKQLHGKNREAMHEMLHGIGKNWATDTTEQQRNGTWIARSCDLYYHILPQYEEINEFRISQLGPNLTGSKADTIEDQNEGRKPWQQ
jgi:hypothetical protein